MHLETLPGGATLVILEFDLAINPVVAVGIAAIDLPGFSNNGEGDKNMKKGNNTPCSNLQLVE